MLDQTSNSQKFMFLTQEKIEQAALLLSNAFLTMNKIWITLQVPKEDAQMVMRNRVMKAYNNQLSVMMVDQDSNELSMVGIAIDFVDYMKKDENPTPLKDWQLKIKDVAVQLEQELFNSFKFQRGQCLYGDCAAANKKFITKHGATQFWGTSFAIYKALGYKTFFGRSSNPITTILLKKFGGVPLKKAYLKGTDHFMEIIQMDLQNLPLRSLSSLFPGSDQ